MQELVLTIDHVWMRLSVQYIFRLYPDEHGKLPFPKRDLINQTTWNCPDNKQQEEGREAQIARNRDRQSRDKDRRTVRESLYVLSRGDSPDQFHFIPMFCCNVPPSAWHFWVRKCLLQAPIVMFHTNSHWIEIIFFSVEEWSCSIILVMSKSPQVKAKGVQGRVLWW